MSTDKKPKIIKMLWLIFGLIILLFTLYVYQLYDAGDVRKYQLGDRIWEIYLVIGVPFIFLGIWSIWKKK